MAIVICVEMLREIGIDVSHVLRDGNGFSAASAGVALPRLHFMKALFGVFQCIGEKGLPLELISIAQIFKDAFSGVQSFHGPYAALRGHFASRIASELVGNFSEFYADDTTQEILRFVRTCTRDVEFEGMSSIFSAMKSFLRAFWGRDDSEDLQQNSANIVSTARILLGLKTENVPFESINILTETVKCSLATYIDVFEKHPTIKVDAFDLAVEYELARSLTFSHGVFSSFVKRYKDGASFNSENPLPVIASRSFARREA